MVKSQLVTSCLLRNFSKSTDRKRTLLIDFRPTHFSKIARRYSNISNKYPRRLYPIPPRIAFKIAPSSLCTQTHFSPRAAVLNSLISYYYLPVCPTSPRARTYVFINVIKEKRKKSLFLASAR